MGLDLKWEYQKRADELVLKKYGEDIDFYDLLEKDQDRIYRKAMELIDEELQDQADMRRKMEGL